jgi:hypothetical protein
MAGPSGRGPCRCWSSTVELNDAQTCSSDRPRHRLGRGGCGFLCVRRTGRPGGGRTRCLHRVMVALCQVSYRTVEPTEGVEPSTFSLRVRCSAN